MDKPNRSFARKVFAAGLGVSMALWAVIGVFANPAFAVEAHPNGTLVLSGGTVWHIADDGSGRHGVPSLEVFYSHRWSFSNVVPANSVDLGLPDLGLMPFGNGVLFNDGGTVFQVSGGMKHGFTSAANFLGNGFSFDNVMPGNLAGLPAGAAIDNTASAHLPGTFVLSGGTVWWITATGRKGVSQPGVLFSYGANFGDLVPANAADLALADEGLANFRAGALVNDGGTIWAVSDSTRRGFPSGSCFTGFGFNFNMPVMGSTAGLTTGANFCADVVGPPAPPAPGDSTGTLTVSLAADTPPAGTAVENAARFGFTKVNLTASGGNVVVDSLTIERTGVSTDSNFSDIILLDVSGGVSVAQANQIGNERSLSSEHRATFNDDISVANGTTKSVLIAANMAAALNSSDQARLELVSMQLLGSATLVGNFPIMGNLMTMNGSVVIGAVTVKAQASPSATTQAVGTNDYIVASLQIINNSVERVEVHSLKFTQNGSAGDNDVANLELVIDGSVVASVAKPTNKEVQFNLANPLILEKGQTKNADLRLDIVDGSSRTIDLEIETRSDVVVRGQTFNYFILPSYQNSAGTAVTTSPFFNPSITTIGNGSITFSKGVLASLNVTEGSSNQALGAFKSTVQGEAIRVTQFVIGVAVTGTGTTSDITNLIVKDANGVTVAGPVDPANDAGNTTGSATTTDTMIFPVGTNTYTVYGTLNSDFVANDTIALRLSDPDGLITAKGEVTNQTITASPTTDLSLDTVTVKTGGLNVSTSATPAAQSVIVGASGFVFANFIFDASGSGEDVRITQLAVVHKTSAASIQNKIANLQLFDGSTALLPIVQPSAVAATTATSTFSLTNPIVVPKGGSSTLTLKGDVVNGTAAETHSFGCNGSACVTAVGQTTGNSVTASVTNSDGQVMTIATSGSMTVAADASDPTQGKLLVGASQATIGELLFAAHNENIDLTDLHFTAAAVNGGALNDEFSRVYLFDGATQIASVVPTTTAAITFANLDGKFVISAGGSRKMTIKVDTAGVTNQQGDGNTADAGDGVSLAVAEDAYGAKGISSGSALAVGSKSGTYSGQQFTVYRSVPTFELVALSSSEATLANGSDRVLFKFKLSADAKGDIGFYQASFEVSTSGVTVTNFKFYEEFGTNNSVDLTNNAARAATGEISATQDYVTILFDTGTDGVADGGEFRQVAAGASKTFTLTGTITSADTGDSVTVQLRNGNAFTAAYPGAAATVDAEEQGRFVWSDLHYGNSSSTATITAQWFNGFRVNGLSSTSTGQTVSK